MDDLVTSASDSQPHSDAEVTSPLSPAPSRVARQKLPSPPPRTASAERRDTTTAAPSRRSHAKSKTGCRTCKRRKIKCDEHRPNCRNCIRHNVTCDFNQKDAPTPISLQGNSTQNGSTGDLNMPDIELMYNFTTFTYATLSNDPSLRQMLRTTAVRMAMENEYLMRMILAVSALHLAHFRPAKKDMYLHRALEHHAASNYKAIALMSDLKREDCEALHLFSLFTLFFALGCPREEQSSFMNNEYDSVVPHWLALVRGPEPILQMLEVHNYKGPLGPLFALGRRRWRRLYAREVKVNPMHLSELQEHVVSRCNDAETLEIYKKTFSRLRHIFALLYPESNQAWDTTSDGEENDTMMANAGNSSPSPPKLDACDILVFTWHQVEFWGLLQRPSPPQEALALFAHLLVVFKKVESQWWLEGWATHVMGKVWALMDDEHRAWTQWPIEELGWVPP